VTGHRRAWFRAEGPVRCRAIVRRSFLPAALWRMGVAPVKERGRKRLSSMRPMTRTGEHVWAHDGALNLWWVAMPAVLEKVGDACIAGFNGDNGRPTWALGHWANRWP